MNPKQLAAIRRRLKAATPGPWRFCYQVEDYESGACVVALLQGLICDLPHSLNGLRYGPPPASVDGDHWLVQAAYEVATQNMRRRTKKDCIADGELIAHAPDDIRALLAEVERLTTADKAKEG